MQQQIDDLKKNVEELKQKNIISYIPNIPIFIQGIDRYYSQEFTISKLETSMSSTPDH